MRDPGGQSRVPLGNLAFVCGLMLLFLVAWRRPSWLDLSVLPWALERVLLDPKTYLAIAGILVAEFLWPVGERRALLSAGRLQDMFYFAVSTPLVLTGLYVYLGVLERLFSGSLGFLRLSEPSRLPFTAVVIASFLIGDFLAWFHHWVRHRVPLFWRFHAVHHAQRDMNLFTDARVHPLDFFIAQTIVFVPVFMLSGGLAGRESEVVWLSFVLAWWPRFYHASVRLRLGPLRYLLVTPQSHRIHHSIEAEHADHNFGVILSLWDRLFGTQCDADVYPETGVPEPPHPVSSSRSLVGVVSAYFVDLVRPLLPSGASWFRR